ncbi:hypothetical protein V7152_17200 [Neobacillus drentensis]
MDQENQYIAADLSNQLIGEIKSLEERLSEEAHRKVIVIAYEKEENHNFQ